MSTTDSTDMATPPVTTAPLRWPPPGLESLHGAVWRAVTPLAAAALVLTAPLLTAVAVRSPFWSPGPFGDSWWVTLLCGVLGGLLAIGGIARLVETLREAARSVRRGHDARVIALIATDASHDAGFLLQGMRQYAALERTERRLLMIARVIAGIGYSAALLWATAGFAIGLLLAGRGILTTGTALAVFVLLPVALLLTPALGARVLESATTRRIHKAWRRDAAAEQALRGEVGEWNASLEDRLDFVPRTSSPTPARVLAIVLVLLAVLLPLPVLSVAVTSSIGSALAQIAAPQFGRTSVRYARTQMLARYALPPDPTITPLEAGQILHVIASAGVARPGSIEVPPLRSYPQFPREPQDVGEMARFVTSAFSRLDALTPAEVAYLEQTATHPMHAELSRVARAGALDYNGARLNLASIATIEPWTVPIPRFGSLRETAYHHVAKAVLHASRGEHAEAEEMLREVISVGALVSRDGMTLIESLIGNVIAGLGATGLENYYVATGRTQDAAPLIAIRESFTAMEEASAAAGGGGGGDLRRLMQTGSRDDAPRGMRWEALLTLQLASPCLSPHATVFGRGQEYANWMTGMREDLVRYPADDSLFKAVARGTLPGNPNSAVARVVGLTLGNSASRSCGGLITALGAIY